MSRREYIEGLSCARCGVLGLTRSDYFRGRVCVTCDGILDAEDAAAKRELRAKAAADARASRSAEAASVPAEVGGLTASLEALLTSPAGFALVNPSPLQRALCHAAEGLGVPAGSLPEADMLARFGCASIAPGPRPEKVVCIAGVRSGKSLIAGAAGIRSACNADMSCMQPHEVARVSILAPTVKLAKKTFRMLTGAIAMSPVLSAFVPPDEWTADTVKVHRPDGREVEVTVVAADPMGMSLRSDWCAGFVFDEVALFGTLDSGAAVNAEQLLEAAGTRLLPGAQGWLISSPYGPDGLLYQLWKESFGKPTDETIVVHAPTRAMNPAFPVEKIEKVRRNKPDVAAREYDALWISADIAFFPGMHIDAALCPPEAPDASAVYVAAWDPATRGNAWTLVVGRREGDAVRLACAWQWIGSKAKPLDPRIVIDEAADALRPYRVTTVHSDTWSFEALRAIAKDAGLTLVEHAWGTAQAFSAYQTMGTLFASGRMRVCDDPVLVADLKSVRRRALANAVKIDLPTTADGRHCDYAPSAALVTSVLMLGDEGALDAVRVGEMVSEGEVDPAVARALAEMRGDGDGEEAA